MEFYTGENLLKTFEILDVNLANLGPEVVKAWFDSDCPETAEFLGWLCQLGRENVVSLNEIEEYDKMVKKNEALEGGLYLDALADMNRTYPGILDVDGQAAETEFMREELAILQDEKKELENINAAQERLNKKLCESLASANNEQIASDITKQSAEEECLMLSQKLDEANANLYWQSIKCSDKLAEYENTSDPVYVSLVSLDEYKDYYDGVLSDVNSLLRRKCNTLPKLEIARTSCRRLNKTIFDLDGITDHLSTLKHRTFHSIQNKNYKEMTERKLSVELRYLKSLKLFDIIQSAADIRLLVESNVSLKNLQDRQSLELENAAKTASESMCDVLKLHFARDETRMALAEFKQLSSVNACLSEILSCQVLAYLIHLSDQKHLVEAEALFTAMYHHVADELHECVLRTEAMQEKIDGYDENKTHSLVGVFLTVLREYQDESCELPVHQLVGKFKNEKDKLETKLFCDDFDEHRESSRKLEIDIKSLRSFLASGPTAECVIMPYNLHKSFENARDTLKTLKATISSTVKATNDGFKRGNENRWSKLKRQLWTYFLCEPQRIPSFIAEIKSARRK